MAITEEIITRQREERRLLLTAAADISIRRQKWLWQDRIPLGTTTVFAGHGGEGKSTFATWIASMLNRGALEGDLKDVPSSVLMVSHEDAWGAVINPRLVGAGADLGMVFKLSVATTVDEITGEAIPALPMDLPLIRKAVKRSGAKMIIFDPITSTMGGDLHKVSDVRRVLDPLTALAQELDIAVIGIMHFNKGAGNASNKLSGSHAFRDAIRSLLLFATDDETGRRIVTVDKSNYSQEKGNSFAFNLVSVPVKTSDGEITEVGTVEYLGETELTVAEIINRDASGAGEASESDDAAAWLVDFLATQGGSAPKRDVENAARREHFSTKVLRRAREKANVSASRQGFPAASIWSLPDRPNLTVVPSQAQSCPPSGSGHDWARLGTTGGSGGNLDSVQPEEEPPPMIPFSEYRDDVIARADIVCKLCGEPTGLWFKGYCDRQDVAHANHRADAGAEVSS